MQYFKKTNINFTGYRKQFAMFSIILTVVGLLAVFILKPVLGIDFKGGAEIGLAFENDVDMAKVRSIVSSLNVGGNEIKSFGKANQILIRVTDVNTGPDKIQEALTKSMPDNPYTVLKIDKIGAKISNELFVEAIWAVLLAIIAILIYIAFRFEFDFGVGAVIALVHDVVITFSVIVITHHLGILNLELDQALLAGLLTVIGYSINDTVIIFDRIRENMDKHKGMDFEKMANMSINETLSRTVNTTATTTSVLLILLLFGGPVLQGFAFTMFIGIVFGTYSSIYIASGYVIWNHNRTKKTDEAHGKKTYSTAKA
ncbi:MAG: protein translocase subunit SecF [Ignavibacteriae bacterium HGW-Ignavibacteriae-1]|nr:MAG: protein translocase subunit SecF [Ignavibacteriae bacterium HGW-Ignavibacteriae-1]